MFNFFKKLFGGEKKAKEVKKVKISSGDEQHKRRYFRIKRDIAIMSPDIPGYRTITRDISLGGVKIELSKPLPKGKIIDISLNIETARSTEAPHLKAEVVWVKQVNPRKWEAGLKFIYDSPQQKEMIEDYLNFLIETQKSFLKMDELP